MGSPMWRTKHAEGPPLQSIGSPCMVAFGDYIYQSIRRRVRCLLTRSTHKPPSRQKPMQNGRLSGPPDLQWCYATHQNVMFHFFLYVCPSNSLLAPQFCCITLRLRTCQVGHVPPGSISRGFNHQHERRTPRAHLRQRRSVLHAVERLRTRPGHPHRLHLHDQWLPYGDYHP